MFVIILDESINAKRRFEISHQEECVCQKPRLRFYTIVPILGSFRRRKFIRMIPITFMSTSIGQCRRHTLFGFPPKTLDDILDTLLGIGHGGVEIGNTSFHCWDKTGSNHVGNIPTNGTFIHGRKTCSSNRRILHICHTGTIFL